jgi:hypothetical protein
MKKKLEYVEGRDAFKNFENAMGALIKVPHSELKAKLDAERVRKDKTKRSVRRDAKPGA